MSITKCISDDLCTMRRSGDKCGVATLGLALSEIELAISRTKKGVYSSHIAVKTLESMISGCKIVMDLSSDNPELASKQLAEIKLLEQYLPVPLSRDAIISIIEDIYSNYELGPSDVMSFLKKNYPGRYNGGDVYKLSRSILDDRNKT